MIPSKGLHLDIDNNGSRSIIQHNKHYARAPNRFIFVTNFKRCHHFEVAPNGILPMTYQEEIFTMLLYIYRYEPTFEEVNWIAWQVLCSSLRRVLSETLPLHSLQSCFLLMLMYDSALVLFERREKLICCGSFYLQNHYQNQHWVACIVWA